MFARIRMEIHPVTLPVTARRLLVLSALLPALVAFAGPLRAEEPPPAVDWLSSLPLALEEALITRRPVLLNFTASWCGWCRKLESSTFRDPGFARVAASFVTVQVDGDKERGLSSMYRVKAYPTTVLLTRQGKELGRIVGYRGPGDYAREMIRALERREPMDDVRRAAEERPQDPRALYAWADVLLAVGKFEEARGVLERVLPLARATEEAGLADEAELDIALSYLFAYDFEGALPLLDAYLDGGEDRARRDEALFFSGLALVRTGQVVEGFGRLDRAVDATSHQYIKFEVERLKAQWEEVQGRG
jgi:thiol-disulfide isomerase/thioredoxin